MRCSGSLTVITTASADPHAPQAPSHHTRARQGSSVHIGKHSTIRPMGIKCVCKHVNCMLYVYLHRDPARRLFDSRADSLRCRRRRFL